MTRFARKILNWYGQNGRKLPWRGDSDPYVVWVSEIMLQQTRVNSIFPYFNRWIKRFPKIPELAAASEQEVLSIWEGLGYYSRARNLRKAAKIIMEKYGGELPHDLASLRKLPGIGRYTVGAIASMAFGMNVATLDGNIRRVYSRVFNVTEYADGSVGEKILWALAEKYLPVGHAGDFNQALMDLGAIICLPRDPDCQVCPIMGLCDARKLGLQNLRPVLKPRASIPHHTVTAAILRRNGKILLAKRPSKGLLGGMWEFPGGKVEAGETVKDCLAREIREELGVEINIGESLGTYHHAYTHFRITLHAFLCEIINGEPKPLEAENLAWVPPGKLARYPMGKVDRQIAGQLE